MIKHQSASISPNHSKMQSNKEGRSEKVVFVRSELIFSRDSKKAGCLDLKEGRRRVIEEGTGTQTKTKGIV